MEKITANESHRRDDIADTFADGCQIALIDKSINIRAKQDDGLSARIMRPQLERLQIETDLYHGDRQ